MFVQLVLSLTILSSLLVASVSGNTGFISQYTIDSASDANYLIFYGDSYTRVGFKLESDKPSKTDPIGNPEYPGVTTSGGINWADLLTTEFNQTTTLTYDFAIGGATINGTLIPPPGVSVDFYNQVKGSMTYLTRRRAIPWAGHKSVVLIWFGQNDVFQASTVRNDSNSIFNDAFTDYFNNVETVYRAGARNFLFVKVAPIVRTPLVQQNYTKAEQSAVSAASNAFNAQLDAHAQAFGNKHYDAKWHVFDPTPTWNRVIDAPTQFGVQNATCWNADGNSCLFYNNFHPAVPLHKAMVEDIAKENYFPSFFTTK